jgi:hypothetical protein
MTFETLGTNPKPLQRNFAISFSRFCETRAHTPLLAFVPIEAAASNVKGRSSRRSRTYRNIREILKRRMISYLEMQAKRLSSIDRKKSFAILSLIIFRYCSRPISTPVLRCGWSLLGPKGLDGRQIGSNLACLGPAFSVRRITDAFRAHREKIDHRADRQPLLRMLRMVVIGS